MCWLLRGRLLRIKCLVRRFGLRRFCPVVSEFRMQLKLVLFLKKEIEIKLHPCFSFFGCLEVCTFLIISLSINIIAMSYPLTNMPSQVLALTLTFVWCTQMYGTSYRFNIHIWQIMQSQPLEWQKKVLRKAKREFKLQHRCLVAECICSSLEEN